MAFTGFNTGSPFGTPTTTAAAPAFGSPATTLFGGTGSPAQSSPFNLSTNQPKLSFGGLAGAPGTQPSFQFGATTTPAQPAQPGFAFGSTPAAQPTQPAQTGFNFGAPAQPVQAVQPVQSGFGFGTPSATAQPGLGAVAPTASATPSFSFGPTTTAAPLAQTGTAQSAFSFGPTTTAAPLAQTGTAQSGFNFATTTTAAPLAQTGFNFGAPTTAAQPAQTGFSFGPKTTAAQPAQTGFSFTAPAAAAAQPAQPGFSFGPTAQPAQPAQPTLTLGAATTPAQKGFSFGPTTTATPIQPASAAPTLGFSAPATTAQTQPSAFSSAPPTGGLSFGTPSTTAQATTGLTLGTTTTSGGLSFGPGSSLAATKPAVSFATPLTTSLGASTLGSSTLSTPTLGGTTLGAKPPGLSFPATTTTAAATTSAATGISFSFPTPAATQAATTTATTQTATTTATTTFKGLGGVDPGQVTSGTSTASGTADKVALKDNPIPNELMQCVEHFKTFVKTQKSISSEVARASVKPMDKISENTDAMRTLLTSLATSLQKNKAAADKIRAETIRCFQNCEMAQRTQDTPSGLQNQNLAPLDFFVNLISTFDHDLNVLKLEIENAERHVKTLTSCAELSPQELSQALRKLHDSFVALAGRLQGVHSAVQALKNQHLTLRRTHLKDSTNVFEKRAGVVKKTNNTVNNGVTFSPGPTPFAAMGNLNNLVSLSSLGMTKSAFTPVQPVSLSTWNNPSGLSLPSLISNTSMINQSTSTLPTGGVFAANTPGFQLQKPPLSNKRGKR